MKKGVLLSFTLLFFLQTVVHCQTGYDPFPTAFTNLKARLTAHVREEAYLQLDRPYPYYVAGESIYFKAYLTMGELHQPSAISNVLRVELIGNNAVILQSISIALTGGTGWGDFSLPENLPRGNYTIRAYTNWMRNEKEPEYFYKALSISSATGSGIAANNANKIAQPSLQFFPEGGSFVAGLPSKIGFKALNTDGMGLNLTGVILNNDNKEVARIKSSHLGIGVFNLVPQAGQVYKAKVTFANGLQLTQQLPAADPSGITLAVNNDDPTKLAIEIRANNAYFKENFNKGLNLIVYSGGIAQQYTPKLDNAYLGLDLPVKNFKTGIVRVSLFTAKGEPLNERLSFVQGDDILSLSVKADKQVYTKRGQVKLGLNARLRDQNVFGGSFSVSVIDESKVLVDEDAGTSNLAYFLLTSEVKGNIEKPDYYFNDLSKQTRADLDALMLTQAYRRFVWKELMQNGLNTMVVYKPETGLNISGNFKTKAGKPIANCTVTLIGDSGGVVFAGVTDNKGYFSFKNISIQSSSSHYILKAPASATKNAILTLEDTLSTPTVNPDELASVYENNAEILASLQSSQNSAVFTAANSDGSYLLIKNNAGTSFKTTANYRSSNLGGPGHADQVISGDLLKTSPTLSVALNGRARGVNFISGVASLQTGQVVQIGQQKTEPMLIILDGAEIGIGADLDNINPANVETVEILKGANAAIYGIEGGQGVIVITSRQGNSSENVVTKEMSPGIYSIEPKGLYKAREFYSPAYNTYDKSNVADHRTTIFWKPDIITDANGNASFSFFNADGTGTYRVCVEGIDGTGNLGRQVFRYQVK